MELLPGLTNFNLYSAAEAFTGTSSDLKKKQTEKDPQKFTSNQTRLRVNVTALNEAETKT